MSFLLALPVERYNDVVFTQFSPTADVLTNARAMMWLSQLAYETNDPDKVAKVGRLWSLQSIDPFNQPAVTVLPISNTRGVVASKGNATLIAFAGSDPLVLPDWIADFSFRTSSDHIHEGFQGAVNVVWPQLGPVIQAAGAAGRTLFFTGHSLGGALAVIAAERARLEGKIQGAQVYTFGMPRVGTADFVARYGTLANTTQRFTHGQDIVPTVPPREFGFEHVGHEIHCASGAMFVVAGAPAVGADASSGGFFGGVVDRLRSLVPLGPSPSFRNDLLGRLSDFLPPGIRDHIPSSYFHALAADERK